VFFVLNVLTRVKYRTAIFKTEEIDKHNKRFQLKKDKDKHNNEKKIVFVSCCL
jgi:hypothetical protein